MAFLTQPWAPEVAFATQPWAPEVAFAMPSAVDSQLLLGWGQEPLLARPPSLPSGHRGQGRLQWAPLDLSPAGGRGDRCEVELYHPGRL